MVKGVALKRGWRARASASNPNIAGLVHTEDLAVRDSGTYGYD